VGKRCTAKKKVYVHTVPWRGEEKGREKGGRDHHHSNVRLTTPKKKKRKWRRERKKLVVVCSDLVISLSAEGEKRKGTRKRGGERKRERILILSLYITEFEKKGEKERPPPLDSHLRTSLEEEERRGKGEENEIVISGSHNTLFVAEGRGVKGKEQVRESCSGGPLSSSV